MEERTGGLFMNEARIHGRMHGSDGSKKHRPNFMDTFLDVSDNLQMLMMNLALYVAMPSFIL